MPLSLSAFSTFIVQFRQVGSCVQTFTYVDGVAPVINGCPTEPQEVECSDIIPDLTDAGLTVSDNCESFFDDPPTLSTGDEMIAPQSGSSGYTITRVFTATDASGNTATCEKVLNVRDTTAPTILACPADVSVCPDAPRGPDELGFPNVDDNCAAVEALTVSFADDTVDNGDGSLTITRTFTVTDLDGNTVRSLLFL